MIERLGLSPRRKRKTLPKCLHEIRWYDEVTTGARVFRCVRCSWWRTFRKDQLLRLGHYGDKETVNSMRNILYRGQTPEQCRIIGEAFVRSGYKGYP